MLITVKELVGAWAIRPTGVVHIGAHGAEESEDYQKYNWKPVIWVEANQSLIEYLRESVPKDDVVICAALWDQNDISLDFNVASNCQSSSLKKPLAHLKQYPEIRFDELRTLKTKRLDSLLSEIPNFVNIDVQGAELEVLRGMGDLLTSVDYIYTEVNDVELYENCTLLNDLDAFLGDRGFRRICLRRAYRSGWGDALYVREEMNLKRSTKIATRTLFAHCKNQTSYFFGMLKKLVNF